MAHADGTKLGSVGSIHTANNRSKFAELTDRGIIHWDVTGGDPTWWRDWNKYVGQQCFVWSLSPDLRCTSVGCQCACHVPTLPEGLI